MKKTVVLLCGLLSLQTAFGQCPNNLIMNGNFETLNGTPPGNGGNISIATGWSNGCATVPNGPGTPDVISNYTTTMYASIPLEGRIAQRGSIATNRVFAGMAGFGPNTTNNPPGFGESVVGTIIEPLSDQYEYTISMWDAIWGHPAFPDRITRIEVLLRKPNDCTSGKLVYTSGILPVQNRGDVGFVSANWNFVSGNFVLTAADVAEGYTRMEIRFNGSTSLRAGLDDVCLTKRKLPIADFTFVTIGQTYTNVSTPYGPEQLTQVCASPAPARTPVLINGAATTDENGYGVIIQEFNPTTYQGGTILFSGSLAQSGQVPSTDINVNNLPSVGMQAGQIYMVTLYVGSPYTYKSRLFRINPLPTLNAGPDGTFCSADGINITTSNWPVKVYKPGGILVGTYYSNPIMLPVGASTNYSFITTNAFGCSVQDDATLTLRLCSRASFVFPHHLTTTTTVSTPYGPEPLYEVCSPYTIDGSASTNENAYHLRIQEFNPTTYSFLGNPLYNNWYGTGAAGTINLASVISPLSFTYGNIYFVSLSVGPDWHSASKLLKPINCTKSGEMLLEEIPAGENGIQVFPNPTSGSFTVVLADANAANVTVTNVLGERIFNRAVVEETSVQIDLGELPSGVYMVHVKQLNGQTTVKKIVKN